MTLHQLKVGFFSVYPDIYDVMTSLGMRLIPWFEGVTESGAKRNLTIVRYDDAQSIIKYNGLTENIQDFDSIAKSPNPSIVFKAISPVIKAWLNENNYLSCTRTLTSLFIQISEDENPSLTKLVNDMSWQLKEEYEHAVSAKARDSLIIAIENLENINLE